MHGEGWCFFSFSTNVRVRETSGTEGEAKKEIYKRYIYTYNTNKYIFLYPLFLERNRRFDNQEKLSRVSSIELISMSYISLSLLVMILMTFLYWNATIRRPIRVRYLRSRSEKRVDNFLLLIVNRRDCRRLNVTPTKIQGVSVPTF